MNIISWNCQGSGGKTVSTLNIYLRCTKAIIAFVSDTRCSLDITNKRVIGSPLCNFFGVPSEGRSGGLWLLLSDDVLVNICRSNKFYIFVKVSNKNGSRPWGLVAVYGDPTRLQNPKIWEEIEEFIEQFDSHACLFGDFNDVMSLEEKSGGSNVLGSPIRLFREWFRSMGLLDLGYHGPAFTWSNRAMSTISWAMTYNESAVFHLPRFNSDHMPILICSKHKPIRARHVFRCENWWNLKDGFDEVCQKAALNGQANWSSVNSCFKQGVKNWLGESPTPDMMLRKVEDEMRRVNGEIQDREIVRRETDLRKEHQHILIMQEQFWHQRARLNWAVFGDNNTQFFHATAVARKRRNTIRALKGADGNWVSNEKEIRALFVNCFKHIYKKARVKPIAEVYTNEVFQDVKGIPSSAHVLLEAKPTTHETFKALMTLGTDKAVGPDGFSARLIQEKWPSFGPAIMKEVGAFFQTDVMPSHISRSNMVLIPKVEEAVQVTDFRPISVCNVIYKLI